MKKRILTLAILLSVSTPADAKNNDYLCVVTPDQHTAVIVKAKEPFVVRHPKLHAIGRKIRFTCQKLQPIVSFGGSCAQIVLLFAKGIR